jgi:hypothetical protein
MLQEVLKMFPGVPRTRMSHRVLKDGLKMSRPKKSKPRPLSKSKPKELMSKNQLRSNLLNLFKLLKKAEKLLSALLNLW